MTKNIVIGVLVAATLLFGFLAIKDVKGFGAGSGATELQRKTFYQGLGVGSRDQFSVSNVGVVTTSASWTSTGSTALATTTINGLLTHSPYAVSTTTLGSSATMKEIDLLSAQYTTVNFNLNSNFTWTLPASSTLTTFIPNAGERAESCFYNATTTAELNLIFAAGTGIDLTTATGTTLLERIAPASEGCLTFRRQADTDISVRFETTVDSD